MITCANLQMAAQLKKIWKECFGDEDNYINFYFKNRFEPENTYVYMADGKAVSMLTLMDAKLMAAGEYRDVYYVYAVATLPQYRGKGISGGLLKFVNDLAAEAGKATFLNPAEESLFNFYGKQGYETCFFVKNYSVEYEDLSNTLPYGGVFKEANTKEYKNLRDRHFEKEGYINWCEEAVDYAIKENEFVGGKAYIVEDGMNHNIILYRIWEGRLIVKETTLDGALLNQVLKRLMADEGVKAASACLCAESALGAEEKFAMISGGVKTAGKGYFNLALN